MKWLAAAIALSLSWAADASASPFHGLWNTPVEGGVVRLEACGQDVCGYVVNSPLLQNNPDQRDVRNDNAERRDRRIMGLNILRARALSERRLGDGWVYNPEDGKTYRGSIEMQRDGTLRLTGCVVWPLCQTQTWRRRAD